MTTQIIEKDIPIFYLNVPDFPQGIKEKFEEMLAMLPDMDGRSFYGISYMNEEGKIIYNCGVTQKEKDEHLKYGGTPFLLPKGIYLQITINDWMNKLDTIAPTFDELMKDPQSDKGFPCVEWYKTAQELICMVKKLG